MTKNIAPAAPASSSHCTSLPTRGHTKGVNGRQRFWMALTFASLTLVSVAPAWAQAPKAPAKPTAIPQLPPRPLQQPPQRVVPPVAIPNARPPAALPAVPGQTPAPAAPQGPSVEEKALRGGVVVERAGQALALGTALAGDGRILTALSPLGSGNDIDVRFADGTVVRAKLGHHDRMWDLALLVPQSESGPKVLLHQRATRFVRRQSFVLSPHREANSLRRQ